MGEPRWALHNYSGTVGRGGAKWRKKARRMDQAPMRILYFLCLSFVFPCPFFVFPFVLSSVISLSSFLFGRYREQENGKPYYDGRYAAWLCVGVGLGWDAIVNKS